MIILTDHAKSRLRSRGITPRRLDEIIQKAPRQSFKKGATTVNHNGITVVHDGGVIITAFRQSKHNWRKGIK